MEIAFASLITGVFGVVAVLISNGFTDRRGYRSIDRKIGNLNDTTLGKQHENIESVLKERTKDLDKVIKEKTSGIYAKVEKINDITIKNENLYKNLNQDQKEVRNSVNNLVRDWEKAILENKELKLENKELLSENRELASKIHALDIEKEKMKLENTYTKENLNNIILENQRIGIENKDLKAQLKDIITENKNTIEGLNLKISQLEDDYKTLSKELDLANETVSRLQPFNNKEDIGELEDEENDWDLER
ncbi:MAG: hypothetical protein WCZ27_09730 [Tissierellaceae bacterium]